MVVSLSLYNQNGGKSVYNNGVTPRKTCKKKLAKLATGNVTTVYKLRRSVNSVINELQEKLYIKNTQQYWKSRT